MMLRVLAAATLYQVVICEQKFPTGHYPSTLDIACRQLTSQTCPGRTSWTTCPRETKSEEKLKGYVRLRNGKAQLVVKFHRHGRNWYEALQVCQREGATLVKFDSKKKVQMFKRKFGRTNADSAWIGLHDRYDNDTWFWTDDSPVHYDNWSVLEPNNVHYGRKEDCAAINVRKPPVGKWKDFTCKSRNCFVCEG